MSDDQLSSYSSTLAQLSAALLAVVLTLVALIPTLVELVRARGLGFLSNAEVEDKLRNGLAWLGYTIWLFVIATIGGMVGVCHRSRLLAELTSGTFVVGILVTASASYRIAALTRSLALRNRDR